MRFDTSPHSEKGVCHLQGLAKTSVTVDAPPFGQIWFRSVIRVRKTGVLTTGLRESICRPVQTGQREAKRELKDRAMVKSYHFALCQSILK